ncbi:MAG: aminoacyl-tRNA hydrolase [Verrucomicrobiales bacterium]|nr:aminoacyl-tRNA hydrolase [Verrucomicrobiales bacterium]
MSLPLLIAGLGNPGAEYARTRHNAGFLVLEELARDWRVDWRQEPRFESSVARADRGGRVVWLVRPLTFMNASGEAVGAVARYYRVPVEQILVVVDDADLPLGTVRLRPDGSSGGHHGLESVEAHLGTRKYARQRLGIGRLESGVRQITGHVLGRFSAEEAEVFERVLRHAVSQVTCWLDEGIEKAMARYNGPAR